jgi:hypothetical protein
MAVSEVLEDVLIHPDLHSEPERALTLEVALYQLRRPLGADDAAGVLGVSKPTVLSWVKAGLLPAANDSRPRRVLLDPAAVFAAKRVLQGARLKGAPAQRVLRLRELTEAIYWATHPTELSELEQSFKNEDAGKFVDIDDEVIERARQRLMRSTRQKP